MEIYFTVLNHLHHSKSAVGVEILFVFEECLEGGCGSLLFLSEAKQAFFEQKRVYCLISPIEFGKHSLGICPSLGYH